MRAAKNQNPRAAATPVKKAAAPDTPSVNVKKAAVSDTSNEDHRPRISPSISDKPATPVSEAAEFILAAVKDGILHVDPKGDVVLRIEHGKGTSKASHSFRVSTSILKKSSRYFEMLLNPDRFGEGSKVEESHKLLREQYGDPATAPPGELPVVDIEDLGRISKIKAVDALLTDFFLILYGKDLQTTPLVGNLANLAIVADRFDALATMTAYVSRKKMIRSLDAKTSPRAEAALSEEKVRQRILVATLLDFPPWMDKYSARLITKGWVGKEADVNSALWRDLPSRVEDEIAFRRECVLETIQSLQSYFLGLYTSRERQCKLGYDSSAQCDSFQLGEMIRFFTRVATLQLQGALIDTADPPPPYEGDVLNLLDALRQIPEYQIDKFHSHCGIRTRLIPLLDFLQECLRGVGICAECWKNDRQGYAWTEAKRPLVWKRGLFTSRGQGCGNRHASLRELFTAGEKDWSS